MTDDLRSLREHLADERLYAGAPPAPSAHPAAWRATLLARYPDRCRPRPAAGTPGLWRLILLVALPLAVATTVALLAMAGVDLTPRFDLPRVLSGRQLPDPLQVPRYVWYGLAALSTLLTFLVRGRVPRLLPVDW